MKLSFMLNGHPISVDCPAERRLIDLLREDLHLCGTKEGCGEGECGACTVLLEGQAVLACLILAAQVAGLSLQTIEGLAKNGKLNHLQQAFVDKLAVQCGYCTPGMILSAHALLLHNPQPSEEEIRIALAGNICRCSGYQQIITAVQTAAAKLAQEDKSCE